MKLTDDELKWLAEEYCGATTVWPKTSTGRKVRWYLFPNGLECAASDWDPLNNWNHLRLVLEALVTKLKEDEYSHRHAWYVVLDKCSPQANLAGKEEDYNFAEAVICEALATRKASK